MSNYILLIIDMYNEKEEEDRMFHPKIKLLDFYKKNKIIPVFLMMAVISIICYITFSFIKIKYSDIYSGISIILYGVFLIILIPLSDKAVQKNHKKNLDAYDFRLEMLRNILNKHFKLYESKKIQELIKQCDLSIGFYQLSTEIFKPLINMTKSVLFPIVAFSFGLIIRKVELGLNDTIRLTVLVVIVMLMFLALFYIVKVPIENFLDNQSNKIKRLKGMLIDISLKDFIKEDVK